MYIMFSSQDARLTKKNDVPKLYGAIIIINVYRACYASRRSRTRGTVKLTVCLSVPAVTAQRLQCDEN